MNVIDFREMAAPPYPALFTGTLDGKPVGLHGSVESVEALAAFIESHHAVKVPDGWRIALERALPFLDDEANKYGDDGSNEPMDVANTIRELLAAPECKEKV